MPRWPVATASFFCSPTSKAMFCSSIRPPVSASASAAWLACGWPCSTACWLRGTYCPCAMGRSWPSSGGHGTSGALAPQKLVDEGNRHVELGGYLINPGLWLGTHGRHPFS